ncbi:hypothetical protein [Brevibacillus marinus]|uniref:hypothetical protein n=1 Tax=Brevibacillus marinus TaxID=2496837 RepID=UPI0013DF456D|nr:hypothetical protein [Brevibacillus marinus]
MTFFSILAVLIVGLALLIVGVAAKQRWVKILSVIPLALAIWQLIALFAIGM